MNDSFIGDELFDYAVSMRRKLHACPELSGKEFVTSAIIRSELESMGYAVKTAHTGLFTDVRGRGYGAKLAFRADFDALPVRENTRLPFAADCGNMHACGHDAHTAMLLTAAKYFVSHPPAHDVRLIFQFGEEGEGGALTMIEGGAIEGIDEIYAFHLCPEADKGVFATTADCALFAGVMEFDVCVKGRTSHCASPENGADAIASAMRFATEAKLAVEKCGGALMHTGKMSGGSARNVVAGEALLECSFRYTVKDRLESARGIFKNVLAECDARYGTQSGVRVKTIYPPLVNDASCVARLSRAVKISPSGGRFTAEDFAFYLEKVKGCMCWLGIRDEKHTAPLHSDTFDFDEGVLALGAEAFVKLADTEDL